MLSACVQSILAAAATSTTRFTVLRDTPAVLAIFLSLKPRCFSWRISRYLVIRPSVYFVRTELCKPKLDRFPCLRNRGFRLTGTLVSYTLVSRCNSLRNTQVIHKRRKKSSTIFCSQYEEKDWYNQICDGESTLADAIMDRISFDSYKINIEYIDKSMREVYGLSPSEAQ